MLYTKFELREADSPGGGRGSAGGKLASLSGVAALPAIALLQLDLKYPRMGFAPHYISCIAALSA